MDRPPPGGLSAVRGWSFNTWLMVVNVGIFVAGALAPSVGRVALEWGHFSTQQGFFRLEVWRLVTFQFLHANWLHLFFNMFGLWLFGAMVEQRLGFKRYAAFYLVCGIFGAVLYLTLNLIGSELHVRVPGLLFQDTQTPLIGASAGVFGVLMAAAYFYPDAPMQIIFLPITIRLRTLVYAYVGLALFNLLVGGNNAGGDAAHLGGAAAGWFFVRRTHLLADFFEVFGPPQGRKDRRDARRTAAGGGAKHGRGSSGPARPARAAPDPAEVDRILAKVQATGLHSLTDREKDVLRSATETGRTI